MHTITGTCKQDVGDRGELVRKSTSASGTFRRVSRDLTPEENDSARVYMRDLLRLHDQNQSAVAPKIGMVPSGISRFLAGKQGTSRAVCAKIAELLNCTVEEVLGHAPRSTVPTLPDVYPERARALLRLRGILPQSVEEQVRSTFLDEEAPPFTERQWIELAMLRLNEHDAAASLTARLVGPAPAKTRRQ